MVTVNPVLAHKLGLTRAAPLAEDAVPATPMRQMRRALARAADKSVGLSASVLGISEEDLDAEDLIETGPDGWVVLGLRDATSAGLSGLFLIDPQLRSALVEMQTIGTLLPAPEEQRAVTRVDAVMTVPFASQLLGQLAEVGFGAKDIDPAAFDIGAIDNLRTAGLVMLQGNYRCWRVTIQMGGDDAQGEMLIAVRPKVAVSLAPVKAGTGWATAFRKAVNDAPAELDAVLTRMKMPISKIEAFEVGQVLNLAGTTVGSVTLTGPGGEVVAMARLGQVAGKRAVRLEQTKVQLQENPPRMAQPVEKMTAPAKELTDAPTDAPDLVEG